MLSWTGVVLFFVSAYFLAPVSDTKGRIKAGTVIILFLNFIINGTCGIVGKYFAVRVENGNAALYACLCYAFVALFFCAVLLAGGFKAKGEAENSPLLPKKIYLYGTFLGIVCASIVYFSTLLSRTIPIVVLNTVPNAVCMIGSLVIGVLLFREKSHTKIFGTVIGIISTVIIVL